MSDDKITIEIDGKSVEARPGQMLIEVTDGMGTYVPRFCYHHKLSVAANCRMCLVEVEKAPKPLPACATPVMDGMKVSTKSDYARDAQKSVMEFLLINHPLDCPICDQGGECELQDLAMGYGNDVSRYQESKRVVKDKDIGPLVQTEMTRCIHCTRCVRFGEEIAGMRELGATGRGEFMEIGTYIEKSMVSEMSGNVIELCPVGALTSKPFRFSARTWEMKQLPGIAAHDAVGSNLHYHVRGDVVKRVVPAENEAINEVWLSDRDRFSYEALYSEDRLHNALIKVNGEWQETDLDSALQTAAEGLRGIVDRGGAEKLAALVSANSSTEELYLLQKIYRALGSNNIDHRLDQSDFSDQAVQPAFPSLGQRIAELESVDAALLIGGNLRKEQPILNHRLRKAALKGAAVMQLNPIAYEFNYALAEQLILPPQQMVSGLATILKAALDGRDAGEDVNALLAGLEVQAVHRRIADSLRGAGKGCVVLGTLSESHPQSSLLRSLAGLLSRECGVVLARTGTAANSAGAWLAGALPHRGPGAGVVDRAGLDATAMVEAQLPAYLVYNCEPELDHCQPTVALDALLNAECVVVFSAFDSQHIRDYADVILPLAVFAENEGSFVNIEGQRQVFANAAAGPGDARPGWKLLRVLANELSLPGFDYESLPELAMEVSAITDTLQADTQTQWPLPGSPAAEEKGLQRFSDTPMNSADTFVRRARALQLTTDVADGSLHVNSELAGKLGVTDGDTVRAEQNGIVLTLPLRVDDRVADDCVRVHARHTQTSALGAWFGNIELRKA